MLCRHFPDCIYIICRTSSWRKSINSLNNSLKNGKRDLRRQKSPNAQSLSGSCDDSLIISLLYSACSRAFDFSFIYCPVHVFIKNLYCPQYHNGSCYNTNRKLGSYSKRNTYRGFYCYCMRDNVARDSHCGIVCLREY